MSLQQLQTLKDFGFAEDDIHKALAKFGNNLDVQQAVDYILEGCPPDNNSSVSSFPAPVSYPLPPSYDQSVQQSEHEAAAAQSLAALQNQRVNNMSAEEQWKTFQTTPSRPNNYGLSSTFSDDGNDNDQAARGRAGRPSPVDGSSAAMPIDLTTVSTTATPDTSVPPLIDIDGNEEDEMQRAIRLSLQDQSQMTGYDSNVASAGSMSRVASQQGTGTSSITAGPGGGAIVPVSTAKSKEEQEEEDMRQAMNASMADMASSGMLASEAVPEDPKTQIRASADTPVILIAPSALTSHIPALLQVLFADLPFRAAILRFRIPWEENTLHFLYMDFHQEVTAYPTKSLLPDNTTECVFRIAALQRLFVYMSNTKRSKGHITDFLDTFGRAGHTGVMASPLEDLKELHKQISASFSAYAATGQPESEEDYKSLRQILFTHALPIESFDKAAIAALETYDMDPYNPENESPLRIEWIAGTDLVAYPPEMNDTYSALDGLLASEDSHGFLLTPSQSLSFFLQKDSKPPANTLSAGNTYAPPPGPPPGNAWETPQNERLFKVVPELRLDRYVWQNRGGISEIREKHDALRKQLSNLKRRQASLATHAKTGRSILGKEEDGKTFQSLLWTVQERLETLAEGVQDAERKNAQIALARKLEQIIQAIKQEADSIAQQIARLTGEITELWDDNLLPTPELLYDLRSLLFWRGIPGRESCHAYVRSGRAEYSLDGRKIGHDLWWRVGESSVVEVSQSEVLNDTTGMLMQGAGALVHGYTARHATEQAKHNMDINPLMAKLIDESNRDFAQGLPAEYTQSWGYPQVSAGPTVESANEDAGMPMATDSLPASTSTSLMQTTTMYLRGGASNNRRRSSISSDTGSIASTSRVRIGDDEGALSDGDVDEANGETVELGFAEKMTKKGFKVVKDVGKIGGRPTWLNCALPLKKEMIQCQACQAQMIFLLQINAPKDDLPQASYRTLYVYTCSKASCLSNKALGSTRVFRTQLPSDNPYYDVEDPAAQSILQRFKDKQYASFCADCKMKHEGTCTSSVWKEWLIETGPEELDEDDLEPEDAAKLMSSATLSNEDTSADANEPDTKSSVDAAFLRFQDRLDSYPDQVLRYYPSTTTKKAEPLWASDDGKPGAGDIANCVCGSSRSCEFQILSTILSYIGVDDLDKDALDFGTIAVFTCDASCSTKPPDTSDISLYQEDSYKHLTPQEGWMEEVGFVQNYSSRGLEFR